MAPYHVAQEPDRDHAADHHAHSAEERLACEGRQNVRNNSEAGDNRDVNLRMPEEPEQVLPQKWRASGMGQERVTHNHASGIEEAGARRAIENKQNTSRKKVC